jgi:uncharacterized protein (TIGR00297 family)
MKRDAEDLRQLVHVGVGAGAFLLRWLTWRQAVSCALAAMLFNAFVLPRLSGGRLFRPGELSGHAPGGILLYPLSVLALLLLFPGRLDIVAAAWGVLAAGDGFATIAGTRLGATTGSWPWNASKSYAGSAALWLAGGITASVLLWWTAPAVPIARPWWFILLAPFAASAVAMFVETIPVRLDDNVSVPLAAAATLWALSLIDPSTVAGSWPVLLARLPGALAVNAGVALVSWRLGTVSRSGVLSGLAVGLAVWTGAGFPAWCLLLLAFLVAAITSRLGLRRKRVLGIAQEGGGRRGAGNVLANCLLAAAASLAVATTGQAEAARLVLAASLVTSASDTAASEFGKAWGRRTWSLLRLRTVPPGEVGGVSLEGTAAGLLVAVALAWTASGLGLVPPGTVWMIVIAATAAALLEGVLGELFEHRGVVNNDMLNFIDTIVAAVIVLGLWRWLGR